MLAITLPHVDAWNVWYEDYGNSPEGFAALSDRISEAARDAGRDPADIERSACALVVLDRSVGERAITSEAPPLEGGPDRIAAALRELDEAGADEAILVLSPINERSIRELGEALAVYRSGR
jgi:alkanesulfonate monooxygenase SsuD/methylene tetrahydromethanopterin reductase-like flavin-dependent oxidoreductase (luciferase family)